MVRQTAHPSEPRYEILALFTAALIAASLLEVAVGTLMPFFGLAFGKSQSQLGLIVTAILLGNMLTAALSGGFCDRFGDKAVLIGSGAIMGLSLMIAGVIPAFAWLLFWLFLYGIGYAAIAPAGSHAILFYFSPRERGLAMGIRQAGVPIGGFLGAILFVALASQWGYGAALLGGGLVTLLVTVGAALLYREPSSLHGEPLRAGVLIGDMIKIGREPRLLLLTLTAMLLFCAQIGLMGFFPSTLVKEVRVSPAMAATVFVASQVFAVIGRLFWGWASDRYFHGNRIVPLAILCVLCAAATFATGDVAQRSSLVIFVIAALLGFTAEGWFGVAIIAMAEIGGQELAGEAVGFGLTWVFAAGVVAPLVLGFVIDTAGFPAAWHWLSLAVLLGVVPALIAALPQAGDRLGGIRRRLG